MEILSFIILVLRAFQATPALFGPSSGSPLTSVLPMGWLCVAGPCGCPRPQWGHVPPAPPSLGGGVSLQHRCPVGPAGQPALMAKRSAQLLAGQRDSCVGGGPIAGGSVQVPRSLAAL